MIEITNKQRGPVQLIVKSKKEPRTMTVVNVPGLGSGNNVFYLKDELTTKYIDKAEKVYKLITTKYIPNIEFNKGD